MNIHFSNPIAKSNARDLRLALLNPIVDTSMGKRARRRQRRIASLRQRIAEFQYLQSKGIELSLKSVLEFGMAEHRLAVLSA